MKRIAYSLFKAGAQPFEMRSYIRGFYFNARMNKMIYPDWRTHLEVDGAIYAEYQGLFDWLVANNGLSLNVIQEENIPLCRGMLWRMKPIFTEGVTHVLCRDTDSITTYREALTVQEWLESGKGVHALNDNPAHGGMMGGMVGFNTAFLKACMEVSSWDQLVAGWDLSLRGSDQHLMNQKIYPRVRDNILMVGGTLIRHAIPDIYAQDPLPQVDKRLWESNLTCRHIGSAGVVDMEVLRFFKRFDEENNKYIPIEQAYQKLFYWHFA